MRINALYVKEVRTTGFQWKGCSLESGWALELAMGMVNPHNHSKKCVYLCDEITESG